MKADFNRSLKFYDPSTFWKMDWRQALADLPYVLFAVFFSQQVANDTTLFRSLSPLHLLQVFVLVSLFLPLYLGFIYAKYKIVYPRIVSRIVILFALLGFLIQLMFLVQLNIRAMEAGQGEKYIEWFFLLLSLFLLFLIPASASGGFKMGRKIFSGESLNPEKHLANLFAVALGICLFLFQFIYFLDEERTMGWRWLVFFLEVAFSIFAANRVFVFVRFVKRKLQEKNQYHRVQMIFETVFPFIITSVLLIWSQVANHAAQKVIGDGAQRPMIVIVFALILSGVIPFRLFLLFNPPLRFLNLLSGIVSFSFFLWSIT